MNEQSFGILLEKREVIFETEERKKYGKSFPSILIQPGTKL